MNTYPDIVRDLQKVADAKKAQLLGRYFKTGPGQYGEGDVFLGISVPVQRSIAKRYLHLSLSDIQKLLASNIHEHRFTALEILVAQFERADAVIQKKIFNFYLKNTRTINNWDLVDTSASYIVGEYLQDKNRDILYKLARSKNLWEKRIAVISCFAFIKNEDYKDALKIAELLVQDTHDLIHKAVGWMLREVGKKSRLTEEIFLKKYHKTMPRTMLRYALEHFPEYERKHYMAR
jgi:3-methyladenine DNA glycosylase AlkD